MAYSDILLDEVTQDFVNVNGDIRVGNGENQIMYYLIITPPGGIKEYPLVGGNAYKYVNAQYTNTAQIASELLNVLINDAFPNAIVDVSQWPTIIINDLAVRLS